MEEEEGNFIIWIFQSLLAILILGFVIVYGKNMPSEFYNSIVLTYFAHLLICIVAFCSLHNELGGKYELFPSEEHIITAFEFPNGKISLKVASVLYQRQEVKVINNVFSECL